MRFLIATILAVIAFSGCTAPHPKITTYLQHEPQTAPAFVKTRFSLTIKNLQENNQVDAIAFCIPNEKYRIEFSGPLGIPVASFLWSKDRWELYVPEDNVIYEGMGEYISIFDIKNINIHLLLGAFWNQLIPDGWQYADVSREGSHNILSWVGPTHEYTASISVNTGEVSEVTSTGDDTAIRVIYSEYEPLKLFTVPTTISHTLDGQRSLLIHLNDLDYDRTPKEKYWKLKTQETVRHVTIQ